jgi:hypothetical protein
MAWTILFRWLADKLGGVKTFALLLFYSAVLRGVLLLHPPFAATMVLVRLIGVYGAVR